MFSLDDPALIYNKLASSELLSRVRQLPISNKARVRAKWNPQADVIRHWTQIPQVRARLNARVTGNPEETFEAWVCRTLFAGATDRRALSLGCGDGDRELAWARRGVFDKLLGLDLSPDRIGRAQRAAAEAGLSNVLEFRVADVNELVMAGERFDAVIFEHSLHHFTNVSQVLDRVHGLLAPGGVLLVDEFIGARRFQWSKQQLILADMVLRSIPSHLRRYYFGDKVKSKNLRAGEFLMWLSDPSEAVESDQIEKALTETFLIEHCFDYGGTISHLVFHDIAQNFVGTDSEAEKWVNWVLDAEEDFMRLGLIRSDFSCFVCRP